MGFEGSSGLSGELAEFFLGLGNFGGLEARFGFGKIAGNESFLGNFSI